MDSVSFSRLRINSQGNFREENCPTPVHLQPLCRTGYTNGLSMNAGKHLWYRHTKAAGQADEATRLADSEQQKTA